MTERPKLADFLVRRSEIAEFNDRLVDSLAEGISAGEVDTESGGEVPISNFESDRESA